MACVHRLKHVERLAAAAFADDYAVGTHSEAVANKVADRHGTPALYVRGAGLETDDVRLLQPWNAKCPMLVTESGIVNDVRPLQYANA